MKHTHLIALSVFITAFATNNARAITPYANSISTRNIAAIQHSLATNAIETFEGTMAAALGNRAHLNIAAPQTPDTHNTDTTKYGQMPIYGEFNDDGTAYNTHGHNGGDIAIPEFNSLFANWQHFDDNAHFNNLGQIDSDYDVVSIALAGGHIQIGNGISQWGVYGGYAGGEQKNSTFKINEQGGHIGVYSGYNIYNFNISATVNVGTMFNSIETGYGDVDYTNTWVGGMAHGAYNIAIDNTLTLQPEIYIGATWVKSDDYTYQNEAISNTNLTHIEITPGIRAIKYIGAGWFGTAGVRYVAGWTHGGDAQINDIDTIDLKSDNYTEYGISVVKSIDRFNVALHIGRRDGGRTGWNGGTSFKYIF
ncbi:MAG: autotransporter outer membrane beta-barrel domain-containing protein [Muribaculaceae bacterium]|nr:autotransporter outer membrane beta-barrel domain-containing protein [Muribaculaceae bacterium]